MLWYYLHGDKRHGPVTGEAFDQLVATGKIRPETLVWHPGLKDWSPLQALGAAQVRAGLDGDAAPRWLPCVLCGQAKPQAEMLQIQAQSLCSACKDIYLLRLREGTLVTGGLRYARFMRRAVAKFLDYGLLALYSNVLGVMMGMYFMDRDHDLLEVASVILMVLSSVVIQVVYHVWFIGKYGATLGKMAVGIKVITPDGGEVSYLRAFCRYLLEAVSSFALYLGYVMALYDDRRRTLHDMFCHTRVVLDEKKTAAKPAAPQFHAPAPTPATTPESVGGLT